MTNYNQMSDDQFEQYLSRLNKSNMYENAVGIARKALYDATCQVILAEVELVYASLSMKDAESDTPYINKISPSITYYKQRVETANSKLQNAVQTERFARATLIMAITVRDKYQSPLTKGNK